MVNDIGFDMDELNADFPEISLDSVLADYDSKTYMTIDLTKEDHIYLASFFLDDNNYSKIKLGNTIIGFPPSSYKRPDEPFHTQVDVNIPILVKSLSELLSTYKGTYDFTTGNISRKDKKSFNNEFKLYK